MRVASEIVIIGIRSQLEVLHPQILAVRFEVARCLLVVVERRTVQVGACEVFGGLQCISIVAEFLRPRGPFRIGLHEDVAGRCRFFELPLPDPRLHDLVLNFGRIAVQRVESQGAFEGSHRLHVLALAEQVFPELCHHVTLVRLDPVGIRPRKPVSGKTDIVGLDVGVWVLQ